MRPMGMIEVTLTLTAQDIIDIEETRVELDKAKELVYTQMNEIARLNSLLTNVAKGTIIYSHIEGAQINSDIVGMEVIKQIKEEFSDDSGTN